MLAGYSKENLEKLGALSKTVREEVHDELHKPVYTSEQREIKRNYELTTRRATAMIATGGSSSFIKKELREQLKMSSPDLKATAAASMSTKGLTQLVETSELEDGESVASTVISESKIGKAAILQETISSLYDAIKFPTIILTNVKLKTIVKQRVRAKQQPSLCERTRPDTNEDESFHRDQYYDIHIYGSTRGVAYLLLCWPELNHLSSESFHSTEPEEMINWFAPTSAATICNSKPIGKIILTKNQIKEFGVPAVPSKVIASKYEDKSLKPPVSSDDESSDVEDEEEVKVVSSMDRSKSESRDSSLPQFENWGSASNMSNDSREDEFVIGGASAGSCPSPQWAAQDAVRRLSRPVVTMATIGEQQTFSRTPSEGVANISGRSSAISIDVALNGEELEEARENYSIKLEWLRWFMLIKHRVIVEARPALTSLRHSIMSTAMHKIAHGMEANMSPTNNTRILESAGMHTDEYNVILCRPKVPTHIQGYKWSLLETEVEDTSGGSGASKKKKEKTQMLSKRQVALYFRDTAGSTLGGTAERRRIPESPTSTMSR
jgi:hypothetical protein